MKPTTASATFWRWVRAALAETGVRRLALCEAAASISPMTAIARELDAPR